MIVETVIVAGKKHPQGRQQVKTFEAGTIFMRTDSEIPTKEQIHDLVQKLGCTAANDDIIIEKCKHNYTAYTWFVGVKEKEIEELNENDFNKKAEVWKRLLFQYELKLHYYGEFISSLRRVSFDKNRDATSKIELIKRKLYSFRG